jgi:8-oxo-dGTP pyrophosphatase MutT (NUDIX family)
VNDFNDFCEQIKKRLAKRLPGDLARMKMAPSIRMPKEGMWKFDEEPIESAVCILLYPSENKIYFPLIKRAGGTHSHGGQISFPGGKYEKEDKDLKITALRETFEEIGIEVAEQNVLGRLSLLYVPVSNYMINPYVAFIDKPLPYNISKYEVQFMLDAELLSFFNDDNKFEKILHRGDIDIIAPYYSIKDEMVWGATAMILSEFEALCGDLINKL